VTLSYATSLNEESAYYKGAVALKETAEKLSDGCLKVKIYANAQLGTDEDMIQGMQLGSIDMASPSTAAMGSVVPEATVLDLPFMFTSYKQAHCVLDGEIGTDLVYHMFDDAGFHPLGYWEIGFRDLTNSKKAVKTPDDVKGLKIRTVSSKISQKSWNLVGAQTTTMDFTELYNALQTGVVDGQNNPLNIILSGKLYEVQKHLTILNDQYSAAPTSVSDKTWKKLSPQQQDVLKQAVAASVKAERAAASGAEPEQLKELKAHGMEVVENPDLDAFAKQTRGAWSLYTDQFGQKGQDNIDKIQAAAQSC
jgi:tripartite ATP-independent transporter DctP family solute receptor